MLYTIHESEKNRTKRSETHLSDDSDESYLSEQRFFFCFFRRLPSSLSSSSSYSSSLLSSSSTTTEEERKVLSFDVAASFGRVVAHSFSAFFAHFLVVVLEVVDEVPEEEDELPDPDTITGVIEVSGLCCCLVAGGVVFFEFAVFEQFDAKETVTPEVELRIDFSTFKVLGCLVGVMGMVVVVLDDGFSNGVAIIVNPCFNLSKIEIPWPSAMFVFVFIYLFFFV